MSAHYFLQYAGANAYENGFIEHYAAEILYAHITRDLQITLGALLLLFNLMIYIVIFRRGRQTV